MPMSVHSCQFKVRSVYEVFNRKQRVGSLASKVTQFC
jgi:hypothetical protein